MASRISTIVPLLLITLLCVGGVEAFYYAVERYVLVTPAEEEKPAAVEQEKSVSRRAAVRAAPRAVDHGVILTRNLFGAKTESEEPEQVIEPEETLEATSLAVVLMGTVHEGNGDDRAIILNKKDRKQEIYRVGDTVQGAEIRQIRRGKVVLRVDGRDESLDMSEASKYASSTPSKPVAGVSPRRRPATRQLPSQYTGDESSQQAATRVVRPRRRIVSPQQTQPVEQPEVPSEDVEGQQLLEEQETMETEEVIDTGELEEAVDAELQEDTVEAGEQVDTGETGELEEAGQQGETVDTGAQETSEQ